MAKYKLDELCEFITDGTHQTPEYCEKEGIIFLSSKDVTERKINWSDVKYIPVSLHEKLCKRLKPQKNDILLAKNGTTGVAAIVDRDEIFDVYVSLAVLRPLENIYPKYLLYAVNSPIAKKQFDAGLKGIGVPNLHLGVIRKTVVNIAPRNEQEKICEILNRIENVIDERRKELIALDNLVKARFVEMFGDPAANDMGWDTLPLENACKTIVDCPHSTPSYTNEDTGFMCIRTSIVKKNRILWDDIEYIPEHEFVKRIQRKKPGVGDIIYTREGAILGIAAIIDRDCNVALGQRSMLLSPNTDKCTSEFLCVAMNSDSFLNNVLKGVSGSASPHINVRDIKAFRMIMPPIELQNQFAEFVKQVDKSKVAVQKALDETQLLFDSLMQEYFG